MNVGTKSLLFGAHQFLLHPLMVFIAWWKLWGFPWNPRLWVAFVVHDLGYWRSPNMDGPEGERHMELGARIMHRLFDPPQRGLLSSCHPRFWRWNEFCLFHSRFAVETIRKSLAEAAQQTAHKGLREHFLTRAQDLQVSPLGLADKWAIVLTPWWLYVPMVTISREIREYRKISLEREGKYWGEDVQGESARLWYRELQKYIRGWVLRRLPAERDRADRRHSRGFDLRWSRLLHIANSSPPHRKMEFYALKERLLRAYGTLLGYDCQHVEKECWTCEGTGVYKEWVYYKGQEVLAKREPCRRCNDGVYSEFWVLLEAWKWGPYEFHTPIDRSYSPKWWDAGPDGQPTRRRIEGYIRHRHPGGHLGKEAAYRLYLRFEPRLFLQSLGKSGPHRPQTPLVFIAKVAWEIRCMWKKPGYLAARLRSWWRYHGKPMFRQAWEHLRWKIKYAIWKIRGGRAMIVTVGGLLEALKDCNPQSRVAIMADAIERDCFAVYEDNYGTTVLSGDLDDEEASIYQEEEEAPPIGGDQIP